MATRFAARTAAMAVLSAAALSAAALAAPQPPTGTPMKGSVRIEPIRVRDPDGGPLWGVRTFRLASSETCEQFGRIAHGKFGATNDKGHLVRVPYYIADCLSDAPPLASYGFGGVQTNVAPAGCKYPILQPLPPGIRPPPPDPRPTCTTRQTRVIVNGVFGHDLIRATFADRQGHHRRRLPIGPRGDFFAVMRGAGLTNTTEPIIALTFNSGCRREGRRRLGMYHAHRAGRCLIVVPDMLAPLPPPPTPRPPQ